MRCSWVGLTGGRSLGAGLKDGPPCPMPPPLLDSGLRRNDGVGGPACSWRVPAWPPMHWRRFATLPTTPLDSGLRRNDEVGGPACSPRWVVARGSAPDPGSVPRLRFRDLYCRNDVRMGGRPALRGGWLHGGSAPLPHRPSWIPAFAGMTKWERE